MSIIDKPIVKTLMLKGEKGDPGDLDSTAIVDNLTTNRADKVLSAKQGKVLNDKIDDVNAIKPSMYDTVALMKADTDLIDGDYAQTLGYYSANDGGGATYKITAVESETDYQEELDNELYATLIVDSEVNVKQFGAYGDNTHDDTLAIQNAINYLKNKFLDNSNNKLTLILSAGTYLISDTIEIPVYLKIKVNDNVVILSNVSLGATIWVNSGNYTLSDDINEVIGFNIDKKLIGGTGQLSIIRNNEWADVNNDDSTSIGLLIGDSSYNANYMRIARFIIENVCISGFNTALKINDKNTYFLTFNHLHLELNRISLMYGSSGSSYQNSGENISFNRCIFATSYNAFINNSANSDGSFNFNECSFDFNGNVCLLNNAMHSVFNNCHFEGIGYTDNPRLLTNNENTTGFGSIIYNNFVASSDIQNSIIEINSPNMYLSTSNITKLFRSIDSTSNYPLLVKFDCKQNLLYKQYNFENILINDFNTILKDYDTRLKDSLTASLPYNRLDVIGNLSTIDNLSSLSDLNDYDLSITNAESVTLDTTNKIFDKSLKFEISSKQSIIIDRKIYNFNKNRIFTSLYFKPDLTGDSDTLALYRPVVEFYFYNKDDKLIKPKLRIALDATNHVFKNSDDWYLLKPLVANIPLDTDYILIKYEIMFRNSSSQNILCSGDINVGGILID